MITIVSYGVGNIGALATMYKRMSIPTRFATTAAEIEDATHVILPGVGGFDDAMNRLNGSGLREPLDAMVARGGVPVLGICVGMQMLGESSDEGQCRGLGWVPGQVRHFDSAGKTAGLPLPHMGWNDVSPVAGVPLFKGLETDARFYFLHSYCFECSNPAHVAAQAEYGSAFTASVRNGCIYGMQGHPEKSHHWGAMLLKNFAELESSRC
ncbi:MAG: imidazole glycerol phosphate synthase subunit HisH [Roseateles sp.]|uniref:imidazole glycerol phosphate synthase subunit HisH n=1 Tax=Roseateles sp. TaxID=1971397 RepID=UPI0040371857